MIYKMYNTSIKIEKEKTLKAATHNPNIKGEKALE